MPQLKNRLPKYRKHKASGQAVVTLDGQDIYLGPHGTQVSRSEYDRVVGEWMSNGRCLHPAGRGADITIAELIRGYWRHCKSYYRRPDGTDTGELENQKQALRPLKRLYAHTMAGQFGPLSLKTVQQAMIDLGWCRSYINKQIGRVRQVFKWGVANELIPASVYHGLLAVAGLKRGRTDARESEPVRPVPEEYIDAVLPHVSPQVKAMIELQLLTGMRPGEVVIMRGVDIDRSNAKVWVYRPEHHKTEHHGHKREIWLGPKAQMLIEKHLKPNLAAYLFSPKEAEAHRYAQAKIHRRPDQKPNKRKTTRKLGDCYDVSAYRRAIARACETAFVMPEDLKPNDQDTPEQAEQRTAKRGEWHRQHVWHPHQLRHNAATRLRREFGIESARIILGHKSVAVTEIYAEQDVQKARTIMAAVG